MASVEESPEECYYLGDLESGLAKKVSVACSALLEHIPSLLSPEPIVHLRIEYTFETDYQLCQSIFTTG